MKFFAFLLSIVAGVFLAIVVVKPKGEKYLEMLNKSTVRPTFDINSFPIKVMPLLAVATPWKRG